MSESYSREFEVVSGDFINAGKASRSIKNTLSQLGIDNLVIRRIAVASYEAEINLIIHSWGGFIRFSLGPEQVALEAIDHGPGIENIELAMKEGWSTASDEVREMGFGAGMGLPNMRLNADDFGITSQVGVGTHITMKFNI